MSKGSSGSFSGTKGANKAFSEYPKTVHSGRQDKHIVGSNNYTSGRSIFSGTTQQAEQLIKKHSGTGQILGSNRERVDFGKQIGYYVDPQTNEKFLLQWALFTIQRMVHISFPPDLKIKPKGEKRCI